MMMSKTAVAHRAKPEVNPEEIARAQELSSYQRTLQSLETDFFAELALNHYVLSNEQDERAARILPVLLEYAVRVEEKAESLHRRFSESDRTLAFARKASGLLPKVRTCWQKGGFTYEYCTTRKILWESLAVGIMECGYHGEYFDPVIARALLSHVDLSESEHKTMLNVLREKFDSNTRKTARATRYLLSEVVDRSKAEYEYDWRVVLFIVKAAIKHSELNDLSELALLLALHPPGKKKS